MVSLTTLYMHFKNPVVFQKVCPGCDLEQTEISSNPIKKDKIFVK